MMRPPRADNPYQVLGVEREAGEAEIKRAYFARVREHPPERDPEGFKRIRAAYEQLRAGKERAETDLFLIDEPSTTPILSSLRHSDAEPPPVTRETVIGDLLALEGVFLLEELSFNRETSQAAVANTGHVEKEFGQAVCDRRG